MLTRVFKSGNSLAVRIPKELAIADAAQDIEIERVGNTLVLRPVTPTTLAGIGDIFAMFSDDFMEHGREFHPEQERAQINNWNAHQATGEGITKE
jgi:antitoxin VapB